MDCVQSAAEALRLSTASIDAANVSNFEGLLRVSSKDLSATFHLSNFCSTLSDFVGSVDEDEMNMPQIRRWRRNKRPAYMYGRSRKPAAVGCMFFPVIPHAYAKRNLAEILSHPTIGVSGFGKQHSTLQSTVACRHRIATAVVDLDTEAKNGHACCESATCETWNVIPSDTGKRFQIGRGETLKRNRPKPYYTHTLTGGITLN